VAPARDTIKSAAAYFWWNSLKNARTSASNPAAAYAAQLTGFFDLPETKPPHFDLIFLGLGEDGHTASLFPESSALNDTDRWVTATYVEKLKTHRLTLTFPAINHAAQISFLIAGQSKAAVVKAIVTGQSSDAPAARIKPSHGKLTWLITEDAAGDLRKH
jgi:6-phosphogluconolactonase